MRKSFYAQLKRQRKQPNSFLLNPTCLIWYLDVLAKKFQNNASWFARKSRLTSVGARTPLIARSDAAENGLNGLCWMKSLSCLRAWVSYERKSAWNTRCFWSLHGASSSTAQSTVIRVSCCFPSISTFTKIFFFRVGLFRQPCVYGTCAFICLQLWKRDVTNLLKCF